MQMKTFIPALALAAILSGCADKAPVMPNETAESVPYHELALRNYALGRQYQAEGRFELARDTFLQVLATANNEDMIMRLQGELDATDKLIVSQR